MTTCQTANIVIIFKSVDADGTSVSRGGYAFWRKCSVDMLVVLVLIFLRGSSLVTR
jgi:hypothetical protein